MRTGADVPNKLDNLAKQVSRHCQRCHLTSKKETNSWKLSRTSGQKSQEIFWKEEIKRATRSGIIMQFENIKDKKSYKGSEIKIALDILATTAYT